MGFGSFVGREKREPLRREFHRERSPPCTPARRCPFPWLGQVHRGPASRLELVWVSRRRQPIPVAGEGVGGRGRGAHVHPGLCRQVPGAQPARGYPRGAGDDTGSTHGETGLGREGRLLGPTHVPRAPLTPPMTAGTSPCAVDLLHPAIPPPWRGSLGPGWTPSWEPPGRLLPL